MADIALSPKMASWITLIVCYLIGSIPFGLLFTRFAGLGDVRSIGSGNIGATNVLRTGNKKLAALTLLCDMLKGTLAVFVAAKIASLVHDNPVIIVLGGFAAFIGHIYPVWLKFKGGKGVATYLGVCLGFYWPAALLFACIWILTAVITRYSSLSALFAVILVPIFVFLFTPYPSLARLFAIVLSVMSVIVILKHQTNIRRLLTGKESKIGAKSL